MTIGYRVSDPAQDKSLPTWVDYVKCERGEYAALSARGEQPQSLLNTWMAVWESDMPRAFQTDFEVYGARFFEEGVNEVLIYVGLRD